MNESNPLWTRAFVIAICISFFNSLNFIAITIIITLFAFERFQSSPGEAGIAVSMVFVGSLVTRLLFGRWVDRVGRRKFLLTGLVVSFIVMAMHFTVYHIIALYVIRFLHGVSNGLITLANSTTVADLLPEHRRGEGLGYYMLGGTLAMALGSFLSISIVQYVNIETIFAICMATAFINLISGYFITVSEVTLTKEQINDLKGFKINNLLEFNAIPISFVAVGVFVSYSGVLSFLTSFSQELNLERAASFFVVVLSLTVLFSRPVTGRLFDEKGENFIMYPAFIIIALGLMIFSQAHHAFALLLAGFFIGLGLGVIQSSTIAIAVKLTPKHRLGLANSTVYNSMDAGWIIGPTFLGIFMPFIGFGGVYLIMAMLIIGCLVLYFWVHGRKAAKVKVNMSA